MGAKRITVEQKETFWEAIRNGASVATAAKLAGFSLGSGKALVKKPSNGQDYRELRRQKDIPDTPIPLDEVCEEAKAALADRTGYLFCKRYGGLELMPWQMDGWSAMEDAWETGDREFLSECAPPGGGKSTKGVFFAAKLVVLDRSVRTLFISRANSLAERNTRRLRRLLERTSPAVGAESTLSADFGRFKPRQGGDVWKATEFVVEQMDGTPIEEKEPTCSAFGFDSEWIGNRLDFVFGDDLDSTRSIRNMEIVEGNREIFDNELEARLEPGGLFMIAQQRLGAFDFSNHVRSKMTPPDDDDGETDELGTAQYRRITFKAHYEDRCTPEHHRPGAKPYPDGCLLQPERLNWRDIRKAMNNPDRFKVVYQQEDPGESEALVQALWVEGGRGPDGKTYVGCWDKDRGAWELPPHLPGDKVAVVTVDPSPTRYWSVQAWVYNPTSESRFLLDLHRERMEAPDFLDWSHHLGEFTGLLEDWWYAFNKIGVPLGWVIVEKNAAQRFMLQYDHFHRWMRKRSVQLVAHETHRNKSDPDYGVQMLGPKWRDGQVRLPGKQGNPGRMASMRLVDEVLRYPNSATTDCVMGAWFFEHNLDRLYTPTPTDGVRLKRPSWMRRAA